MSNRKRIGKGFELDEDGNLKIIPLVIPPEFQMKEPTSARKRPVQRREIKIEPLVLDPALLEESPEKEAKMRKVDNGIRKELFKLPQLPRSSRLQRQRTFSRPTNIRTVKACKDSQQGITPLPEDDDEMQQGAKRRRMQPTKGYPFKSPAKPIINFIKQNKEMVKFGTGLKKKTPETTDKKEKISPNTEFLQLEKACATPKAVKSAISPLTDVCNLMKKTNLSVITETITTVSKLEMPNISSTIQQLEDYLAEEERQFNNRMSQIRGVINNLKSLEKQNKENVIPNRRSGRLAAKLNSEDSNSDIENNGSKPITSPRITRNIDLRKTTLARNFAKNVETMVMTPRSNKAVDMYNTMRSEFTILCTPKLNRKSLSSPKSDSNKSLSKALQEQCLMLQQTPSHK